MKEVTDVTPPSAVPHAASAACVLKSQGMNDSEFVPRGAIAFFAAMMIFYVVFWLLMAALMVARG